MGAIKKKKKKGQGGLEKKKKTKTNNIKCNIPLAAAGAAPGRYMMKEG